MVHSAVCKGTVPTYFTNTIIHKSSDLKSLIVTVILNSNKSTLDYCQWKILAIR